MTEAGTPTDVGGAQEPDPEVWLRLSLDFEPGVTYPEATVNEILSRRHADYASLRRHLVDEGFMDGGGGRYWRAGGRVDTGAQVAP